MPEVNQPQGSTGSTPVRVDVQLHELLMKPGQVAAPALPVPRRSSTTPEPAASRPATSGTAETRVGSPADNGAASSARSTCGTLAAPPSSTHTSR